MADEKKSSIFQKIIQAGEAQLDRVILKAKSDATLAASPRTDEENEDLLYPKSVLRDPSYAIGIQGYQEKTARLSYIYLKQMSYKDSIVAAVIQTRQNQVADFAKPVKHKFERGFRIVLKDEEAYLEKLRQEIYGDAAPDPDQPIEEMDNSQKDIGDLEQYANLAQDGMESAAPRDDSEDKSVEFEGASQDDQKDDQNPDMQGEKPLTDEVTSEDAEEKKRKNQELQPLQKAFGQEDSEADSEEQEPSDDSDSEALEEYLMPGDEQVQEDPEIAEEEKQFTKEEQLKHVRSILKDRIRDKVAKIQDFVLNCGELENRPFDAQKWDFNMLIRAWVRDSLTYDQFSTEMVLDQVGELHHYFPTDASTVRYASPQLKNYKEVELYNTGYDILYPEKELEALQEKDALTLNPEKLANDEYVWVQVINGRVTRAFTKDELIVGMRNPQTDIYANGYSLSELELLLGIVTQHIFAENYNKSYYTQGFSAKGILHIKAPLPRRKLETFRVMWNHMIKGAKNSFQTPILAGMEEIQWIPLTQNHSDIEFSEYINYLIKLICGIYQIDPAEIGFGMQEEGGSGGGMAGDNTEVKIKHSKDKGLAPLIRYFETFINKNIVNRLDPDFKLEFVGIHDENQVESINRQKEEVRFKKTVNEIRAEDDLPPIPGADGLILDPIYFQWYSVLHPDGKMIGQQKREEARQRMIENGLMQPGQEGGDNAEAEQEKQEAGSDDQQKEFGEEGRSTTQDEGLRERGRPEEMGKSLEKKTTDVVAIEYYLVNK